jgi:hypothetical protein
MQIVWIMSNVSKDFAMFPTGIVSRGRRGLVTLDLQVLRGGEFVAMALRFAHQMALGLLLVMVRFCLLKNCAMVKTIIVMGSSITSRLQWRSAMALIMIAMVKLIM